MALSTDSSPKNILQFNVLRDPQQYPAAALQRRFIRFQSTVNPPQQPVELNPIGNNPAVPPPGSLLTQLATIKSAGGTLNQMIDAVNQYFDPVLPNPSAILSVAQLFSLFPDFSPVYEWLSSQDRSATVAGLRTEIETAANLGAGQLGNYLADPPLTANTVQLWENFIALNIVQTDGALAQQLTNIIRTHWIALKIINNDPQLQNGQDIYEAARASILLPQEIFPLPAWQVPVPLYRLYNPKTDDHLYTTSGAEKDAAVALNGYTYEKIECKVYDSQLNGTIPLYRLVKKGHFYTTDKNERDNVVNALGYQPEGIACFVFQNPQPGKLVPLYRYYKQSSDQHFYSADVKEGNNVVVNLGWAGEQIACYAIGNDTWPGTKGAIKPCFIADFKTVQTQLLLYAKGEIAQINNLMTGETNSHVVRNFDRTEEVLLQEQTISTTSEKETQETDKNELSVEASQILKDDLKLDVGVNVSVNFPSASIQTKTGFSYQNSRENTNKTASKISKDVMNRALTRIEQTVRTQKTVTTIHETEDTNTHGQTNTTGVPVSSIYRWIDKYYLASLVSYGPRTIMDFVIPEPAAFYIYCKTNQQSPSDIVVKKPVHPSLNLGLGLPGGLQSFQNLVTADETIPGTVPPPPGPGGVLPAPAPTANWQLWAAAYEADNIVPPPPYYKTVGVAYARFDKDDGRDANTNDKLVVDPGYSASTASITCTLYEGGAGDNDNIHPSNNNWVSGQVATIPFDFTNGKPGVVNASLRNATGIIPVSFRADSKQYALNIDVGMIRAQETLDQWRINTYNAILAGYQKQLQAYQDWQKKAAASSDGVIAGNNEAANRETEKEELKKSALELLTAQRFESFSSVKGNNTDAAPPEFDFDKATEEGKFSRFFEDAIEWPLISYMFYPYFWGRKQNWKNIKQIEDSNDPLFTKFLQAGAARVIVPIRPNFEDAINHYLATGAIWNGGDVPVVDSDLYVSIADEMKEAAGHFTNAKVVDQWTVKVPTNMVIIDDPGNVAVLPDNSAQLGYTGGLRDLI